MLKTVFWGAILVATSLLNTYTKFYQNRIKIGRVMSKILYAHIWPPIFFKGLIQNSTPKLKVEIQFCVDSENFLKNIETLLSSIIFNEVNCLNIAN